MNLEKNATLGPNEIAASAPPLFFVPLAGIGLNSALFQVQWK